MPARCGELAAPSQPRVHLRGWLQSKRQFGQLLFLILRDASGTVQVTLDKAVHREHYDGAPIMLAQAPSPSLRTYLLLEFVGSQLN